MSKKAIKTGQVLFRSALTRFKILPQDSSESKEQYARRISTIIRVGHYPIGFQRRSDLIERTSAGFVIYGSNSFKNGVAVLLSGSIKVSIDKRIVQILAPGDIIGELGYFTHDRDLLFTDAIAPEHSESKMYGRLAGSFHLETLEVSHVVSFTRKQIELDFDEISRRQLHTYMRSNLARKVYQATNLSSVRVFDSKQAVSRAILFAHHHFELGIEHEGFGSFSIPLSNPIIRDISGHTIQSVNKSIKQLCASGIVAIESKCIAIKDHDKLLKVAVGK